MANGDGQQGLLGSLGNVASNPLFNLGIGLLSASGPSPTPTSFGQRLGQGLQASQGLLAQAQENQARRQLLQERAAQREAQQQARQRLFEEGASVDTGRLPTPGAIVAGQDVGDLSGAIQERPSAMQGLLSGQQPTAEQVGLLAQAFPDQAGGLLGNLIGGDERAEPSDVRTLRAMGIDPSSPEGRELLTQKFAGANGDLMESQLQRVELQRNLFALEQDLAEQQQADVDRNRQRAQTRVGVEQSLKDLGRLGELNRSLRDSLAETGLPFQEARRNLNSLNILTPESIRGVFSNVDQDTARRIAADAQEFEKLSKNFALQETNQRFGKTASESQLEFVTSTVPSPAIGTEANSRIALSLFDQKIADARARGIELDEAFIENQRRRLRLQAQEEERVATPAPAPMQTTPRSGARSQGKRGDNQQWFRFDPLTGGFDSLSGESR